MSLIAYIAAAICFLLMWLEASVGHLLEAGLFFVAVGLALDHLPAGWPRP